MAARWFRILVLMMVWLILAGGVTAMNVLLGLAVVAFSIAVGVKLDRTDRWWQEEDPLRPFGVGDVLRRVGLAILFVPIFMREVYSSALNVARHAFELESTMHPAIVRVPTTLENKVAIVVLANLITLTPGTLTMDFDEGRNCYYVHCIDAGEKVEDRQPIINMESWLRRIFE